MAIQEAIKEIVFNKNQIDSLVESFNSICIKCDYIGKSCNICPVEESKVFIQNLKVSENYVPDIKSYNLLASSESEDDYEEMEFNKNNILLAQNSLEAICEECSHMGSYCLDCNMHEIRRNLASLPLKEIQMFEPKAEKSESSGGGCGTSCSTGCSTKKKKK